MRRFIVCLLSWLGAWLSYLSDVIGCPDCYDRPYRISLGEARRSWQQYWQMAGAPYPDEDLADVWQFEAYNKRLADESLSIGANVGETLS